MNQNTLTSKLLLSVVLLFLSCLSYGQDVTVTRIDGRPDGHPLDSGGIDPIIDASVEGAGGNTNYPSMIRVPDWIPVSERPHPDAQYYLYYSSHSGSYIRMAWAEFLTGEWTVWNPSFGSGVDRAWGTGNNNGTQTPGHGVLDMNLGGDRIIDLGNTEIEGHLASPDVFVDHVNQRIVMITHGFHRTPGWPGGAQGRGHNSFVATSKYGLNFNTTEDGGEPGEGMRDLVVARPYARILQIDGEKHGQQVVQTMIFGLGGAINLAPLFTNVGEHATFANADDPGGLFNPSGTSNDGTTFYWPEFNNGNKNPISGVNRAPFVIPDPNDFPEYDENSFVFDTVRNGYRHIDVFYNAQADRNTVYAFYHAAGDAPESILMVRLSLQGLSEEARLDPNNWTRIEDTEQVLLFPELDWEGANLPLKPSPRGSQSKGNTLRDPNFFLDNDGKLYMIYMGMSEQNIGIAQINGIATNQADPTGTSYTFLAGQLDPSSNADLVADIPGYTGMGFVYMRHNNSIARWNNHEIPPGKYRITIDYQGTANNVESVGRFEVKANGNRIKRFVNVPLLGDQEQGVLEYGFELPELTASFALVRRHGEYLIDKFVLTLIEAGDTD